MANVFKNMTIMGPSLCRTLTGSTLLQRRFCSDQVRVKRPVNGASDDRRAPDSRDARIATRQLAGREITHSNSASVIPSGSLCRRLTPSVAIRATPDKESKELATLQRMTDKDIQELKRRLEDIVAQNQKLQEKIGELKGLLGLDGRQQQHEDADNTTDSLRHQAARLLALIYRKIRENPKIAVWIIRLCCSIYWDIILDLIGSAMDMLAPPEVPEDSETSWRKYYIYVVGLGLLLPVAFLLL